MNGIYISIVGAILIAICAVLTGIVAWKLSTRATERRAYRALITVGVATVTIVAMTWDVALTSGKMAKLCPQAGVHVKKSVQVEGFYTSYGSPDMLDQGFRYIESRSYGNRLVVYSKDGNTIKNEEFDARTYQVKSRYEFAYNAEHGAFQGRQDIGIQKSIVRDRQTGEEFGYSVTYFAYPGWVDRHTLSLLTQVLWACPGFTSSPDIEMYKQTLLPLNDKG